MFSVHECGRPGSIYQAGKTEVGDSKDGTYEVQHSRKTPFGTTWALDVLCVFNSCLNVLYYYLMVNGVIR
jgi:hypothetical protein